MSTGAGHLDQGPISALSHLGSVAIEDKGTWFWGCGSVVKLLSDKYKALGFILSTTKSGKNTLGDSVSVPVYHR